jgi:rubrerythrin
MRDTREWDMQHRWMLNDISWEAFEPAAVTSDMVAIVKTAALVEANAADYVVYLSNVFRDNPELIAQLKHWGVEEQQHGAALARWAELADPSWSFDRALADFQAGYQFTLEVTESSRGSRAAELIARQVVETGTSSFYSAIRDASAEPLLREIAARIASDEYFHYQLFARYFASYQRQNPMSMWARLKVAVTRFQEAEDDELGYAYFAANVLSVSPGADFHACDYGKAYWSRAMRLYRRPHIASAVRMILRAINVSSNGMLARLATAGLWRIVQRRAAQLAA